jgi:hypothetical protein
MFEDYKEVSQPAIKQKKNTNGYYPLVFLGASIFGLVIAVAFPNLDGEQDSLLSAFVTSTLSASTTLLVSNRQDN